MPGLSRPREPKAFSGDWLCLGHHNAVASVRESFRREGVMSRSPAELDETRQSYRAAYRAANSGQEPPSLDYERGWWWLSRGIYVEQRVRHKELLAMTERLRQRAPTPSTAGRTEL